MIEHLENTITAVAARCLRTEASIDANTPFDLLGLDSLATIELAAALEAELGCELPPDILADCTNARSLAARLAKDGVAARTAEDPFEQMFVDAVLPDDVRPARRVVRTTDLRHARRILLSGATGFLGQALVTKLLSSTSATLLCLVRPGNGHIQRDAQRLIPMTEAPAGRLEIVEGDLTQPRLGLDDDGWNQLAFEVDAICHSAALVNWVYGYTGLRDANVLGTLELLRLAARADAAFHFVSSLSVCYAADGPPTADENYDALPHLRGVHLGYAQTKVVAEALVREAGTRGLAVRIYRPALISGHSDTGAFNRDDLISLLVRGCIEMGTAPDLDWKLDCQPVDSVASAIVALSRLQGPVFHLAHERPRHWRECVLWMRMYGYDVRLLSYHTWLRQLEAETRPGAPRSGSHPLRPLRSFFLERPAGASGLTLPELYEERRRTQVTSTSSRASLRECGQRDIALDASLLDKYFAAFRAAGHLPPPAPTPHSHRASTALRLDADLLSRVLNTSVEHVDVLGTGSDHSIVSELTAWRSKQQTGLFQTRVTFPSGNRRDVMLKVKAHDSDVMAVGEALADLIEPAVGRVYRTFSDRIGFVSSHRREIEIYRQQDPRFVRHAPALLGSLIDDESGLWIAALERVQDSIIADSADHAERWSADHVERAVDGAAALHSIWLGREPELRQQPWIGYVQSTQSMVEMTPLWLALADHARPLFSSWADPDIAAVQRRLIFAIDRWWPALEAGPRTLIHNDFNPRNICLRGSNATLCAYDWELATVGAPQRDLAELLCFVLPADATYSDVVKWIDLHRRSLERESGSSIDATEWLEGFRGGLYDFLINRIAIYALVHRVRAQYFLPRVVRTWRQLYRLFPLERAA